MFNYRVVITSVTDVPLELHGAIHGRVRVSTRAGSVMVTLIAWMAQMSLTAVVSPSDSLLGF